ncbi:MAG: fatty acid desaturase [Rhizobiaceae bacterium]|nr:fatty acid desaturase [Rhizobiaceae bacterium]
MDHRRVIADLSHQTRSDLTARVDAPGVVRGVALAAAMLVLASLIALRVPFWPVLMLPLGILIVFLFTLEHESVHETAFRTSGINKAAAAMAGFLILLPPTWFRYFHFAHHRHTHDPQRDPELMSPKPQTWPQYLVYLSGWLYWSGMVRVLFVNALGRARDDFVPEKGRAKVISEARWLLGLYVLLAAISIALQSSLALTVWIVPVLLGQPFLRAYLLAEHTGCPHVPNMLENTRTTFTTTLVRFIAWNMPFHAEHHAYPAVPFHKLPEFHDVVAAHLRSTEHGYVRFHRRFATELGDAAAEHR